MTEQATILIVDDVESIRQFVELALASPQIIVMAGSSGQEALDLLESFRCDLVMLDLGLPDMDGLEVCRRIKANPQMLYVPIIGFSGRFPSTEDKVKGFEAGLVDYLVKPLDTHELQARVALHLGQKRRQDAINQAYRTEQQKTQGMLREIQDRFLALAENSFDLIFELDRNGVFQYISPNYQSILGVNPSELIGQKLVDFIHPQDVAKTVKMIDALFSNKGSSRFFYRQKHAKGHFIWFEATGKLFTAANGASKVVFVCRDTTEQKEREDRLDYLANHDLLTGLYNRNALYDILTDYIQKARDGVKSVLLFTDLDHLKIINDTVGHTAGDCLIEAVANILRESIYPEDALVRFAGDEFILVFYNTPLEVGIERAQEICRVVSDYRFSRGGQSFQPRISAGLVVIDGTVSGEELISKADAACYGAKRAGRDRVEVFQENNTQIQRLRNDSEIVGRLKEAMENDRLKLWYMPIVDLNTGKISSYEALVRLEEGDGYLAPSAFLPAAERFRMVYHLDLHVIRQGLSDLKKYPDICASINLSGQSIEHPALKEYILDHIHQEQIDPSRITFEITETAFISNLAQAVDFVRELKKLGVRFALDDFGCGFSSLSYLRHIPVDKIKIDGTFIQSIAVDSVDQALVTAINHITHLLGKKTVAEYVCSEDVYNTVKKLGIDYAQGYYLSEPLPLEKLLTQKAGKSGSIII